MKRLLVAFVTVLYGVGVSKADVLSADVFGGDYSFSDNVVIDNGVYFYPDSVTINKIVSLENNGRIETDVFVANNATLMIKNQGAVDADFYLGEHAEIIQVVESVDDLNMIDFGVDYNFLVDGMSDVALGTLMDFADEADKIIFRNAALNISASGAGNNAVVVMDGVVKFIIDNPTELYGRVLLDNVMGDAEYIVQTNNTNPMYVDVATISDGQLMLSRQRETNYVKFLDYKTGAFLDGMRMRNPDYPLFSVLDTAQNMSDLRDVMHRSVRFNPDVLGHVANTINVLGVLNTGVDNNLSIRGNAVIGDDYNLYGVGASVFVYDVAAWDVGINVQVGAIEYRNDVDEFMGNYYGAGLRVDYNFEDAWFVRSYLSVAHIDTDLDSALYAENIVHGPSVTSGYVVADNGVKIKFSDSFSVSPFAGLAGNITFIETFSDIDFNVRVGCDLNYEFAMLGVRYEYVAGIVANTNGDVMLNGRVGFWSVFDNAGADIKVGVMKLYDTVMYQVGIGAKVWF